MVSVLCGTVVVCLCYSVRAARRSTTVRMGFTIRIMKTGDYKLKSLIRLTSVSLSSARSGANSGKWATWFPRPTRRTAQAPPMSSWSRHPSQYGEEGWLRGSSEVARQSPLQRLSLRTKITILVTLWVSLRGQHSQKVGGDCLKIGHELYSNYSLFNF